MECHTRVLITAHMCVCPKLVVQSERYPIDRLNIAINHMYIMISPTYADVNKLSKTIMAHLGKKTNRPNLGCFQKNNAEDTSQKHHPSRVASEGWKLRDRDAGCTIWRWGCRNSGLLSVALVVNSHSHGYPPWFTGKYKSKWLIFHGYVSLQKSVFERDSFKSKTLIVSKSPMVNQDPWKDHKIYM